MAPSDVDELSVVDQDRVLWVARYRRALLSIEASIPVKVRKIFLKHYYAPDRRLSVLEMGQIAGYRGTRAANLPYGLFAGVLSKAMEIVPPGPDNISAIAEWDRTLDERGHGGWVMYDELAAALEELGWVIPENSPKVGKDVSSDDLITARFAETTLRVGQAVFRNKLLRYWGSCAVTGFGVHQILLASHIVPWSKATDQERMDVYNGLMLMPNLDKLFDQYLISFDEHGSIQVAASLSKASLVALGVDSRMKLRKIEPEHIPYLKRHFTRFQELHKCNAKRIISCIDFTTEGSLCRP